MTTKSRTGSGLSPETRRRRHAPAAPTLPWLLLAGFLGAALPCAHAAYVERVTCNDGAWVNKGAPGLQSNTLQALLLPPGTHVYGHNESLENPDLELIISVEVNRPDALCPLLLQEQWDISVELDRPTSTERFSFQSPNMTCQPPLVNGTSPMMLFTIYRDLGSLGLLPAFATQINVVDVRAGQANESTCTYAEITPELSRAALLGLRLGPIAVFTLVMISGVLVTLYSEPELMPRSMHRRWTEVDGLEPERGSMSRAILPGVGDCLLYLQFIFLMGALTLRYPGFYQPVTAQLSWASLFSPVGPVGMGHTYPATNDGIYEINGTLTGTFGFELLSQITAGPMKADVWWNMVILSISVAALTALVLQLPRIIPSIRDRFTSAPTDETAPPPQRSAARTTWNVIKVVLSYFLTPIVALSAFQLCNNFLPVYHLVLASLMIAVVLGGFAWISRSAPSDQLGNLVLGRSKGKYKTLHQRNGSDEAMFQVTAQRVIPRKDRSKERNLFALIVFGMAFVRGITIGGFQFAPLPQVAILGAVEVTMLISTLFLRPFRRSDLIGSVGCTVARLSVVCLTIAFLPTLRVHFQTRAAIGYAILAIHLAVLASFAVPAILRMVRLARNELKPVDGEGIYGLDRLHRRETAVNDLSLSNVKTDYPGSLHTPLNTNPSLVSPASVHSNMHPHAPSEPSLRSYEGQQSSYFRAPRTRTSFASLPATSTRSRTTTPEPPPQGLDEKPLRKSMTLQLAVPTDRRIPRRHSSTSVLSEGTLVDSAEPRLPLPLAPRWGDYSFREADLFYGQVPGRYDDKGDDGWDQPPTSAPPTGPGGGGVWSQLTGAAKKSPATAASSAGGAGGGGFQVRRPPPPPSVLQAGARSASAGSGGFEVRRPPRPAQP